MKKKLNLHQQLEKIDLEIKSLKEKKKHLYDEEVRKKFSKGDLVIFEDEDQNAKFIFLYVKDGHIYGQSVKSGEKMEFTASETLLYHWKKI